MRPLERQVTKRQPGRAGSLRYQRALLGETAVLLVRTGMGKEHAARATSALMEHARPDIVVATGFAGSIDPAVSPGDFVLAREILEAPTDDAPPTACRHYHSSPELLTQLAGAIDAGRDAATEPLSKLLRTGRLLTVQRPLALPQDKIAAGQRFGANAVDMESSAIVERTTLAAVPTVCARVILDGVEDQLPFDFGKILTPTGRVRPFEAAKAVARHPKGLLQLEVLRRRTALAAQRLAEVVPAIVRALVD